MNPQLDKDDTKRVPVAVSETRLPSEHFRTLYPEPELTSGLHDFLEVLSRRKWLILAFVLCFLVPTLMFSLVSEPTFRASGSVELSPESPKVTKFDDLMSRELRSGAQSEVVKTQIELLKSASLAQRVIDKLQLVNNPAFNPQLKSVPEDQMSFLQKLQNALGKTVKSAKNTVKGWLRGGSGRSSEVPSDIRTQQALFATFAGNLEVELTRDTTLATVSFDSSDPVTARDVVNMLIHEFTTWQMDRKEDASRIAKDRLNEQIEAVRMELEKSEAGLTHFAQDTGIVSLDSKLNLVLQQLEQINAALAKAETERIAKMESYNQVQTDELDSSPLVLQNTLIQTLKTQYIDLMSEYEKLRIVYKDDYPSVKNLKAKMLDIGQRINGEQERILNSVKSEYLAAVNLEKTLKTTAEEKKALALKVNALGNQYRTLEREVEINKQIYQSLLERSKEIAANVGADIGNLSVVDLAQTPLEPYKPNIKLNLLLALALGLMGGVGLSLLLEHLDRTVKRIDEITDFYSIPILGVVPMVEKSEAKHLESLVRLKPMVPFSEAIRTAKVTIQFTGSQDRPIKSLLMTSTTSAQGKSTLSVNLAQDFAAAGEKVLLMNADLRKPGSYSLFGSNGTSRGLTHYLSGINALEEVLQKSEVHNLYYLPSGYTPPNPTELLQSGRMKALMETLVNHFDRIILDGPPFGSDGLVLTRLVDGVVLIATLGHTQHEGLRIFVRSISAVRGHLVGGIINKFNLSQFSSGYYSTYYKKYGSSPSIHETEVATNNS